MVGSGGFGFFLFNSESYMLLLCKILLSLNILNINLFLHQMNGKFDLSLNCQLIWFKLCLFRKPERPQKKMEETCRNSQIPATVAYQMNQMVDFSK